MPSTSSVLPRVEEAAAVGVPAEEGTAADAAAALGGGRAAAARLLPEEPQATLRLVMQTEEPAAGTSHRVTPNHRGRLSKTGNKLGEQNDESLSHCMTQ